jgi:hypothetical protein
MNRGHDMTHARSTGANADTDAVEFDLRDLAFPPSDAAGHDRPDRRDDPFGALGIAGIETPSKGDALAALLGETAPSPADRVPDRRRTEADAMPMPVEADPAARSAIALLDRLHEEFVRVVRDPTQLAGRADWQGALVADGAPAPALEDPGWRSASDPLLSGIVRSRQPIDEVLQAFDPLGQAPSLDPEPRPDVLHLFAPEIARGVRAPLPGLTRREHHALSPDSPMPSGATSVGDGETT